jgi:hypothetical protein
MTLTRVGQFDEFKNQKVDTILYLVKNSQGEYEVTNQTFTEPYVVEKYGGFGEGWTDMTPR